jgi:hypothetical protein
MTKTAFSLRLLSGLGVAVALSCFWVAAVLRPKGFDWNRDYLTTLLRDGSTPSRLTAVAGLFVLCVSVAAVVARLARAVELARGAKAIRIGGIGAMVYASLAFTPMHDLMIDISLVFFLVAVLALLRDLWRGGETAFLVTGCACLAVLVATSAIYYLGYLDAALAWGQRATFAVFVAWLIAMDWRFGGATRTETAGTTIEV